MVLIQYDAEFYEMSGKRNIITILTDGEKESSCDGIYIDGCRAPSVSSAS